MIKNIAYFPSQCAQNSRPVMTAVLDYLQSSGIQTQENSWDSDAAIIWSVLWSGRMLANQAVYQHYRAQNKPVIVLEIGALYRGSTWKVAVNNITRDGYYGHEHNLDPDRPKRLKISRAINPHPEPYVVIAAQHSRSLQVCALGDMTDWVNQQISLVQQHTDMPIRVRPHPRNRLDMARLLPGAIVEQPRPVANTYDSFDMRFDCHAVINHNSGPGIQAAIMGCRPVVHSSSLASPVGIPIADIMLPYDRDLDTWLIQICHTEYTLDELRMGMWLSRIEAAL